MGIWGREVDSWQPHVTTHHTTDPPDAAKRPLCALVPRLGDWGTRRRKKGEALTISPIPRHPSTTPTKHPNSTTATVKMVCPHPLSPAHFWASASTSR